MRLLESKSEDDKSEGSRDCDGGALSGVGNVISRRVRGNLSVSNKSSVGRDGVREFNGVSVDSLDGDLLGSNGEVISIS